VGTETAGLLECLARVLVHIPDSGHVTTRYRGWYANRPRGIPFQDATAGGAHRRGRATRHRLRATTRADRGQPPVGEGPTAALFQQIFEVDPLACPTCRGPMRHIACITQASVIDQNLITSAPARATPAHGAPSSRAGARHAPHARLETPRLSSEDARPHENLHPCLTAMGDGATVARSSSTVWSQCMFETTPQLVLESGARMSPACEYIAGELRFVECAL
jgi:hypothetical protein